MKKKSSPKIWLLFLLIPFSGLLFSACGPTTASGCPFGLPYCGSTFPLNTLETTDFGPAWADIILTPSDFLPCYGPYALCDQAQCLPDSTDNTSACPCLELYGLNFVIINAILNQEVYQETVAYCSANPGACTLPNGAPVCQALNQRTFYPSPLTARVSTFSLYGASLNPTGTLCTDQPGLYAGCMTAACFGPETFDSIDNLFYVSCECPNYIGPFQLGQDNVSCNILPEVYSAAYLTNLEAGGLPDFPPNHDCFPDAGVVGSNAFACPFWDMNTALPPDSGVDCQKVCDEYANCTRGAGIELGFTCDATLCTTEDHDLVMDACLGLENCDLTETFKAEYAAGCSCCAFQLCGCDPNSVTNKQITSLNDAQRLQGVTPQCDVNGLLCGN